MEKETKNYIIEGILLMVFLITLFYLLEDFVMKDKNITTEDGIKCEYGKWTRCGYYLYNCENGKEYKCATNIQTGDKNS